MFLSIPLLSSPVAAWFICDRDYADTTMTQATGITITFTEPAMKDYAEQGVPYLATFSISFDYSDNMGYKEQPSSRHCCELNVQQIEPTVGSVYGSWSGNLYLNNGGSGNYVVTVSNLPYCSSGATFAVWAYVECEDLVDPEDPEDPIVRGNEDWEITVA